jgi:hypothetical protein
MARFADAAPGLLLALAAALCGSACFLGYDSRWGQAKASQQRVANETRPASIESVAGDKPARKAAARVWRVRFHPNAQYLAETVDAQKQIADLVDDANGVLASIGLRLEIDRVEPWSALDDVAPQMLARAQRDDPGSDVDLVVGMFGALPGRTLSLHEAGMATMLGKHVVVRGAGVLGERDAIERSFAALGEDERARILKERKRHRALAVFLHEVGHCLGALHEQDPNSLMNPVYSPKLGGFGGGAIALMQATLAGPDVTAVARAQLELLQQPGGPWIKSERDEAIVRLTAVVDRASRGGASVHAVASAPAEEAPPELDEEARERFLRATQAFRAGAVAFAYQTARPLFAAYPNVFAVQDLRCQLATVRWLPREQMLAECANVMRLLPPSDAGVKGD